MIVVGPFQPKTVCDQWPCEDAEPMLHSLASAVLLFQVWDPSVWKWCQIEEHRDWWPLQRQRTSRLEEQDPVFAFLPCLTLGLLKGQEYCWGDGGFSSQCMLYPGVYSVVVFLRSPPVSAVNWKRLWVSWGVLFIACLPFEKISGIRIFRRETRMPGDTLGEEWAQHWMFLKAWPGQDPFHLAGLFSSSMLPESQKRTIVSGLTCSLTLTWLTAWTRQDSTHGVLRSLT